MRKFITAPVGQFIQVDIGVTEVCDDLPAGLSLVGTYIEGATEKSGTHICSAIVQGARTELVISAINLVHLDKATVEQHDFVAQLQEALTTKSRWDSSKLSTSQTMVELIAAIGTYNTARLIRAVEEAFPSTAQSPISIRSSIVMQGARLRRKQPARVQVEAVNTKGLVVIPPYTQFVAGQLLIFNREEIVLSTERTSFTLFEGEITSQTVRGLGSDLQCFVSREDSFRISDQDVLVKIDSVNVKRVTSGLWNFKDTLAVEDLTLADGRLKLGFGRKAYGAVPRKDAAVEVTYVTTKGAKANNEIARGRLACSDFPYVDGLVTSLPSGGMDEDSALALKESAPRHFCPTGVATSRSQYQHVAKNYPGVYDAVVRAQSDIDPSDSSLMNHMYVCAVTSNAWSHAEKQRYLDYMKENTMYGPHLVFEEAIKVQRDLQIKLVGHSLDSRETLLLEQAVDRVFAKPRLGFSLYGTDVCKEIYKVLPHVRHVSVTPEIMNVKATEYNVLGKVLVEQ